MRIEELTRFIAILIVLGFLLYLAFTNLNRPTYGRKCSICGELKGLYEVKTEDGFEDICKECMGRAVKEYKNGQYRTTKETTED